MSDGVLSKKRREREKQTMVGVDRERERESKSVSSIVCLSFFLVNHFALFPFFFLSKQFC